MLATYEWSLSRTDAGAAAPVAILVHGITGSTQTWWRVGPALAERGWRVVAIDLRGHGDSPRIDGTVTREQLAEELAVTIQYGGLAPADVIIGHSLGAAAVMELAHRRPELGRRVVLEDPPGTDRVADVAFQQHLAHEVIAARETPDAEVARILAENPSWLEADARQNVVGQQRCDLDGISASLRGGMGSRVSTLVPGLTIPALYLLAAEDRSAIGGDQRTELLAGVPTGSRAVELDCGHVIHRDRFEEYIATILGWLDTT